MRDSDYIRAFRFGFGVTPGKAIDPLADFKAADSEGAMAAFDQQRKARFAVLSKANESLRESGRSENSRKLLIALTVRLNQGDIHNAVINALNSRRIFTERLALFWSNHFSLGQGSLVLRRLAGLHVAALRPHLFGRFRDLMQAGIMSPAMMEFLNLQQAIGPNSKAGQKLGKGLNENLGREILELHTLGVEGGYTQADVLALSKLLTGWRYDADTGELGFNVARAEPGSKTLLGRKFSGKQPVESDLQSAFDMLAMHPSTARLIGNKLALHFVGPGQGKLAKRLVDIYLKNDGLLAPVYEALIEASEGVPLQQFRNDAVFLISALRALPLRKGVLVIKDDDDEKARGMQLTVAALKNLRQKLWVAQTPAGWSDDPVYWRAPAVMGARLKVIPRLIKFADTTDPITWSENILGPFLRDQTKRAVSLAPNRLRAWGWFWPARSSTGDRPCRFHAELFCTRRPPMACCLRRRACRSARPIPTSGWW